MKQLFPGLFIWYFQHKVPKWELSNKKVIAHLFFELAQ